MHQVSIGSPHFFQPSRHLRTLTGDLSFFTHILLVNASWLLLYPYTYYHSPILVPLYSNLRQPIDNKTRTKRINLRSLMACTNSHNSRTRRNPAADTSWCVFDDKTTSDVSREQTGAFEIWLWIRFAKCAIICCQKVRWRCYACG